MEDKHALLIPTSTSREEGDMDTALPAAAVLLPPPACAACKHQRKKCGPSCPLAPYFPPARAEDFRRVHQVFGVSNVAKRLQSLEGEDRARAARAMVWEAQCWTEGDPVQGAYGVWLRLQEEANALRCRIQRCPLCSGGNMAPGNGEMVNHPAYDNRSLLMNPAYDNRRLLMADVKNYPQYAQLQGGNGRGQLQLQNPGVLPHGMINGSFGLHQHCYAHDKAYTYVQRP